MLPESPIAAVLMHKPSSPRNKADIRDDVRDSILAEVWFFGSLQYDHLTQAHIWFICCVLPGPCHTSMIFRASKQHPATSEAWKSGSSWSLEYGIRHFGSDSPLSLHKSLRPCCKYSTFETLPCVSTFILALSLFGADGSVNNELRESL